MRLPQHEEDKPAKASAAIGSGYIIDRSGYVGTNKHVVDGAISAFVIAADGVRYPATIVGTTYQADSAITHGNTVTWRNARAAGPRDVDRKATKH